MSSAEPKRGRRRTSARGVLELVPRFRVPADDLAAVEREADALGIATGKKLRQIVEAHVAQPKPRRVTPAAESAIRADTSLDDPAKDLLVALLAILRERRDMQR